MLIVKVCSSCSRLLILSEYYPKQTYGRIYKVGHAYIIINAMGKDNFDFREF